MRRRMTLMLCVVTACIGCSDADSDVALTRAASSAFKDIPGQVALAVHTPNKIFRRVVGKQGIVDVDSTFSAPREATGRVGSHGATMLPNREDGYYRGPFAKSPEGRHVAASVVDRNSIAPTPQRFVIWDNADNKQIASVKLGPDEFLEAVAWSPDGRHVAVLKSTKRTDYSPKAILARISGHSFSGQTFALDIYSLSGERILGAPVLSVDSSGWAELIWHQ